MKKYVAVFGVLLAGCQTVLEKEALVDYAQPVRPIGVNGQEAWNRRSVWFMYAPTFDFTNRTDAASYRFTVTDAKGRVRSFEASSANAALSPVWTDLAIGRADVVCEALGQDGELLELVGSRMFCRQAPYRDSAYPHPAKSAAVTSKQICRYVMDMPIVKANYLSGKPVPKELVRYDNQVFISYPSKMGAATILAMANLAARDPASREEAIAYANGVVEKLFSVTEPEGAPLAGFPRTYESHPGLGGYIVDNVKRYGDKIMTIYPAQVGNAYLALYAVTKDGKLREAARKIADKYLELQGADGTWPLNCNLADGQANGKNRLVPLQTMIFMEGMFALTKDARYREAADRALAYVEQGPLKNWNWEGQFEDVPPSERYQNLTKHGACDTAMYLLARYPGDAKRIAQARELLRFAEDQFVCWETPLAAEEMLKAKKFGVWGEMKTWRCPAVLEQYQCYVPIDASSAKLIRTYLALYRATGNRLDLAKARTLGEAIVRETNDKGYVPTFWFDAHEDWPNCMLASARALAELAATQETQP